jgi:hypothetical protein
MTLYGWCEIKRFIIMGTKSWVQSLNLAQMLKMNMVMANYLRQKTSYKKSSKS